MPKKAQMNANYRKNERLLEDGAIDVPGGSGGGDSYTAGSGISISAENVISNTAPNVPQEQADWNEADSSAVDYIKNKPTIPAEQVNSDWEASSGKAEILNKPTLSTVATSGSYNDLSDKPTIPDAQIQANWNESDTSSKAFIQNKPTIPEGVPDYSGASQGDVLTIDANGEPDWEAGGSGSAPNNMVTTDTTQQITGNITKDFIIDSNSNVISLSLTKQDRCLAMYSKLTNPDKVLGICLGGYHTNNSYKNLSYGISWNERIYTNSDIAPSNYLYETIIIYNPCLYHNTAVLFGDYNDNSKYVLPNVNWVKSLMPKFTIVGDGSTTSFMISHSLIKIPGIVQVTDPNGTVVKDSEITITKTTTDVTVTFTTAPADGDVYTVAMLY